jgi:hypothetical protein
MIALLSACGTPNGLFVPSASTLEIRSKQSKLFAQTDQVQLLQASIGVLQDMGYNIIESNSEVGILTASKKASAVKTHQIVGSILLTLLTGRYDANLNAVDSEQHIRVTVVVYNTAENGAKARATFQRLITKTNGEAYVETINDPAVYQEFYEKLNKAHFLEVNKL